MKLTYVRLINYIGIYNGIGKNEIEINLGNSKNSIIAIKGNNGSGKSTLLRALSPFPDENYNFIPGLEARKDISYTLNGVNYDITYMHTVKSDGTRETTKGYIYRNGESLNPNGNVSSCKELIFSLFCLDNNFISLSQLSSEDRGLADKRPAERKKYVNSILANLDVYNSMHKILSKKSSFLKSTIASITSKIASLGNKEELIVRLEDLDKQIVRVTNEKDNLIAKIGSLTERNNMLTSECTEDPDTIIRKQNEIANALEYRYPNYNGESIEHLEEYLVKLEEEESGTKRQIDSNKVSIENKESALNENIAKLSSLESQCATYKSELENIGIIDTISFSKASLNELKPAMETLKKSMKYNTTDSRSLRRIIDVFESMQGLNELKHIGVKYADLPIQTNELNELIKNYEKYRDVVLEGISELESQISVSNVLKSQTVILEKRPSDCVNNDCPFIKAAVEAKRKLETEHVNRDNYNELLNTAKQELLSVDDKLFRVKECLDDMRHIEYYHGKLSAVEPDISFFGIKPLMNILSVDNLKKAVLHGTFSNVLDIIDELEQEANIIDSYNALKDKYDAINERIAIYNNTKVKVENLQYKITEYTKDIEAVRYKIKERESELSNLYKLALDYKYKLEKIDNEYTDTNALILILKEQKELAKYNTIVNELSGIKRAIKEFTYEKGLMENSLNTLQEERSKVAYSLTLLDDYSKELESYDLTYKKIENIKYYTSPTTGIQTVFMETYMNNIISMANNLLELMFNGDYRLMPFVINESEFRIPCAGKGYINDDISSMSTSQICMISMILSFAILYHASSDYNILKLDEIDGGLDTYNRLQFIKLLEELMRILACEQCIMISHNNELSTDNIDLIVLTKGYDTTGCNVVYQP